LIQSARAGERLPQALLFFGVFLGGRRHFRAISHRDT
jgi:hypothetical protein